MGFSVEPFYHGAFRTLLGGKNSSFSLSKKKKKCTEHTEVIQLLSEHSGHENIFGMNTVIPSDAFLLRTSDPDTRILQYPLKGK